MDASSSHSQQLTAQSATKSRKGLPKFSFKARSKKDNRASLQPRASVNRKTSLARRDSRLTSRSNVGNRRNSRRSSVGPKRKSTAARPTSVLRPISPAVNLAPTQAPRSGGFFRRIARHFTSGKKNPPPTPSQGTGTAPTANVATLDRTNVPNIITHSDPSDPPRIPLAQTPKAAPESGRSKSPAPSATSKKSKRNRSPGRESLASFKYPPLPPSPLPTSFPADPETTVTTDAPLPADQFKLSTPSLLEPFSLDSERMGSSQSGLTASPSLAQSDSDSSHGCGPYSPQTDTSPTQVMRGRQPIRTLKESGSLLSVPGCEDVPGLVSDDEDAWTDDERIRSRSRENTSLTLITEEPQDMKAGERKPLSVVVSSSQGSLYTPVFADSPILEKVDEDDEEDVVPNTAGIEFILPADADQVDPPLRTAQSDKPRSRTLSGRSLGATPATTVRRASMFSKLFTPKREGALRPLSTAVGGSPDGSPSDNRLSRGLSVHRASSLEMRASMMSKRAPTVRQTTNADITTQMETLRTNRNSMSIRGPAGAPPAVVDEESARLTEAAFF